MISSAGSSSSTIKETTEGFLKAFTTNTSQLSFHIQSTSITTTSASSSLAIEQRRVREQQVDYENTFDTTEEPDYLVPLETHADVGVLQSKEWFEWDVISSPLLAGTSLIFSHSVSFKDETAYRSVSISGDIFIRNQLKVLVKVGSVDFQQDQPCLGLSATPWKASGFDHSYRQRSYSLNTPMSAPPSTLL